LLNGEELENRRPIPGQEAQVGSSLVALTPDERETAAASAATSADVRCRADFVAQLIATKQRLPQTRARCRAEPAEGIAAYSAPAQSPQPARHALSRSL